MSSNMTTDAFSPVSWALLFSAPMESLKSPRYTTFPISLNSIKESLLHAADMVDILQFK